MAAETVEPLDLDRCASLLDTARTARVRGRVTGLVGLVVRAVLPEAWVGQACEIHSAMTPDPVPAEVIGFEDGEVLMMPLAGLHSFAMGDEVRSTGNSMSVPVGPDLVGRVLDGLGRPLDGGPPLVGVALYPVNSAPPPPMSRRRVRQPIVVGIRAIDGLLTCAEGQRIGLLAPAGAGKSTCLGMIAKHSEAEIKVLALIGERGREVREFVEDVLGDSLENSVVVAATSDAPALMRLKAAQVATSIAEYFRDEGKRVMLLVDSVTRFARAQREIGLAAGEPPARAGFPPSVFSELPKLLERAGQSDRGSITAFYTVLVEGDDLNEPVSDEVKATLDGHIVLSRELANRGHRPAIDVPESVSRVRDKALEAVTPARRAVAVRACKLIAAYDQERQQIKAGIYKRGTDPLVDAAIDCRPKIEAFLQQVPSEPKIGLDACLDRLAESIELT